MALHQDPTGKERLGGLADSVESVASDLIARNAVGRMWDGDHTLWQEDPTEVSDRLGWLHAVPEMVQQTATLEGFVLDVVEAGFTHAVVMGMGGSSLFPEVVAQTFGSGRSRNGLDLVVLDTTDPAAIKRVENTCPLDTTLFVASSKSGSTIETRSHLAYFWDLVGKPEQFVVVTDPHSELGALARDRGFRTVFENRPDIGGRYSALSYFGLVPAALAGVDLAAFLAPAQAMLDELRAAESASDSYQHPGLRLGAILGAGVLAGVDKVTLILPDDIASFGLWLEQLLAESTGKQGTGVIPVVGEPLGASDRYGRDRLFVAFGSNPVLDPLASAGHPVVELPYDGPLSLGAHVVLWEFATAMCGAALDINPFDQPNVAEAKAATSRVLDAEMADAGGPGPASASAAAGLGANADAHADADADTDAGKPPAISHEPLDALLELVEPGDYLAIQAFVDPGSDIVDRLDAAREALRDRFLVATTLGLGPRYLHSTGQLHKGGPPTGVFIQVVGDDPDDIEVPGQPFTFGHLKQAQAAGDLETLRAHGLRAARVALDELLTLGEAAQP